MNKKLIVFKLVFFMLLSVFFSCNQGLNDNEKKLSTATLELLELQAVADEIAYRFVQKKVSLSDFKEAYENKNVDALKELINMTEAEYNEYMQKINKIGKDILARYPDIKAEYDRKIKEGDSCSKKINIKEIYEKINSKIFFSMVDGKIVSNTTVDRATRKEVSCKWALYTACLVTCTASGPVIYWPCAYVCLCSCCTNHPACE